MLQQIGASCLKNPVDFRAVPNTEISPTLLLRNHKCRKIPLRAHCTVLHKAMKRRLTCFLVLMAFYVNIATLGWGGKLRSYTTRYPPRSLLSVNRGNPWQRRWPKLSKSEALFLFSQAAVTAVGGVGGVGSS